MEKPRIINNFLKKKKPSILWFPSNRKYFNSGNGHSKTVHYHFYFSFCIFVYLPLMAEFSKQTSDFFILFLKHKAQSNPAINKGTAFIDRADNAFASYIMAGITIEWKGISKSGNNGE